MSSQCYGDRELVDFALWWHSHPDRAIRFDTSERALKDWKAEIQKHGPLVIDSFPHNECHTPKLCKKAGFCRQDNGCNSRARTDAESAMHPHEPGIPPRLDDEGRCLVCVLLSAADSTAHGFLGEARVIAAQCWCEPETSGTEMNPVLAEVFARRLAAWMETGAQHAINEEYWRNRALNAEKPITEMVGGYE